MRTLSIYAAILFSIFPLNSFAQTDVKKESIKVWGNCARCKKTIETAAKNSGATYASWNEHTKIMKFSYISSKSSAEKIQKAVAASGYDTMEFTADDNAYSKLDECCKYPREQIKNQLK